MSYNFFKKILDIILAFVLIIVLLPVFIIISLIILISDPGPIFFTQKRIGIHKKLFNLYKFRTMKMEAPHDMPTHLLKNPDKYITSIGKFLRKTSFDELPQLFNILKGDMSFVGPRPALWNQDDLIMEREKYGANDVLPGLTGWAQINGRDELPIQVKAKYDGKYVKNISFLFDLKCFFGTFVVVFTHKGVKEGGTGGI